jgi:hypothetical protein
MIRRFYNSLLRVKHRPSPSAMGSLSQSLKTDMIWGKLPAKSPLKSTAK